jgi:hypothetical protein
MWSRSCVSLLFKLSSPVILLLSVCFDRVCMLAFARCWILHAVVGFLSLS